MYKLLAKTFYIGQVVFSVFVIIFGFSHCLRCLLNGLTEANIFYAVCFALIGYVSGYRLLFRASVKELREHNGKMVKS